MLINSDGYTKVTDFDLAKKAISDKYAMSLIGTIEYCAPQIIERRGMKTS
jgi:serine/threonine protein kinase